MDLEVLTAVAGAGDGTLFEYDESERQWRERGRGEMKVNVGASGTARLIMRNKGNFRLLLNASIWPGMKVTPMEGGKVRLTREAWHVPNASPQTCPAVSCMTRV